MSMFDFSAAPGPVRPGISAVLDHTWDRLAGAGTWLSGRERVAVARVARSARARQETPDVDLAAAVVDVADRIASRPATTSREWVDMRVAEIGEETYVEVMGIATRTVMADTFSRLLGVEPIPLPQPRPGKPTRVEATPRPGRIRSWISVGNSLIPPFTGSLVPDDNRVTMALTDELYMTGREMEDPDFARGLLHRTHIELVASTVSYGNECFY